MNKKRLPELRRTASLQAAVTPSQKARVEAAALAREQITADFVRTVVLAEVEKVEKEQAKQSRTRRTK